MESAHTAKRFLNEGMVIITSVDRKRLNEPLDEVIARTVERLKKMNVDAVIGVYGDAPDMSRHVTIKAVPWKELTELGAKVERDILQRLPR